MATLKVDKHILQCNGTYYPIQQISCVKKVKLKLENKSNPPSYLGTIIFFALSCIFLITKIFDWWFTGLLFLITLVLLRKDIEKYDFFKAQQNQHKHGLSIQLSTGENETFWFSNSKEMSKSEMALSKAMQKYHSQKIQ